MPRDNPSHILQTLDALLHHRVELTLIGKSALWLGFDSPPDEYGTTLDVDAVVSTQESAAMDVDLEFWDALTHANDELRELGLYLTHIFEERQLFLRPDWAAHRVSIHRPVLQHIVLHRPATLDLILTKMMRGADSGHMAEIQWMISKDHIKRNEMLQCLACARLPEGEAEFERLFRLAESCVLGMQYES
jgi:hypothetical protein